jgi:hypothetical protein
MIASGVVVRAVRLFSFMPVVIAFKKAHAAKLAAIPA